MQGVAVETVRGMENDPQELCVVGISQPIEASIASTLARVWAMGQIPQTREAIFGTCSIVLPMASFSIPLTGVMESQSPRSTIP